MLVFAARTKQAIGQMYPCADSEIPRLHANAFLQVPRQTYVHIGKYERIDRSKHEIIQFCLIPERVTFACAEQECINYVF